MSKIQYVPDKESPFIKKLYGKEDNFKVEILTYFGTLCELEKLQNQIEVLEKALELACLSLRGKCDYCKYKDDKKCPPDHHCSNLVMEYFLEQAKEIIKSE